MNIKDYWNVLVNTYKTVNNEKLKAKKILKEKKQELKDYKEYLKIIIRAEQAINDVYCLLDKEERREYVQETIDLLNYGPKSKKGYRDWGSNHYYQKQYESAIKELKQWISDIEEYIHKGKYSEVLRYKNNHPSI